MFEREILLLYSTNVVMNYTEVESKVREATNDDPWGPSGQLMSEISRYILDKKPQILIFLFCLFSKCTLRYLS